MTNKEMASYFALLAKYQELHEQNERKIKFNANLAFALEKLPFEIEEVGIEAVEGNRGIGTQAVNAILQLLDEESLPELDDLLKETPEGVRELFKIKGIGPKKIKMLWREMEIDSPGALLYAVNENRLLALKGFGEKSQEKIREQLEFYFANQGKMLWAQAEFIFQDIITLLQTTFSAHYLTKLEENVAKKVFSILGDYYWQNPIVENFYCITNFSIEEFLMINDWKLESQKENIYYYSYKQQISFVFEVVPPNDFSKTYVQKSFSTSYNELIDWNKCHDFSTEEKIFSQLQKAIIPPYLRNVPETIEIKNFEQIIQTQDVKGLIHAHSKWSDGKNTIAEMAEACMQLGLEYMVLSDHSKSSFYANGLSEERIIQQHDEIEKLNKSFPLFKIFKSIECDILGEGNLDYDDEVLKTFDVVIASIHQNLYMQEEKAMQRLLHAIEHPYTHILGHCTGRLLLTRAGYPINHKKIIDACAANNVVIELNANPRRLDMDWSWIPYALEKNVFISINPDAHSIDGINDIRYGVLVAQKAALKASQNLSSLNRSQFEDFIYSIKN